MEAVVKERMRELSRVKERLQLGGGGERLEKQHSSGKLSARERLALLLDRKSFRESGMFAKHNARLFGLDGKEMPADGVVTGRGRIEGRLVHVASLLPRGEAQTVRKPVAPRAHRRRRDMHGWLCGNRVDVNAEIGRM